MALTFASAAAPKFESAAAPKFASAAALKLVLFLLRQPLSLLRQPRLDRPKSMSPAVLGLLPGQALGPPVEALGPLVEPPGPLEEPLEQPLAPLEQPLGPLVEPLVLDWLADGEAPRLLHVQRAAAPN